MNTEELITDLALHRTSPALLAARCGFSLAELALVVADPAIARAVEERRRLAEANGEYFRVHANAMAISVLESVHAIAHDPAAKAADRIAASKLLVLWAGLEPVQVTTTTAVQVNVQLREAIQRGISRADAVTAVCE